MAAAASFVYGIIGRQDDGAEVGCKFRILEKLVADRLAAAELQAKVLVNGNVQARVPFPIAGPI